MIIHVVRAGETAYSIANTYGIDAVRMMENNGYSIQDSLVVGQTLVVLVPSITHAVSRGETLSSIAALYGVSVLEIYQNNFFLRGRPNIYPGLVLAISYGDGETRSIETNAYAYTYIDENLYREQLAYLTYVTPFTYGITTQGNLVYADDERLIRIAKEYDTAPLMHLSTLTEGGNFSSEVASLAFNNPDVRSRIISQITANLQNKGYFGLDVDFEFINPDEALLYAGFLSELSSSLRPLGYVIFSALAPKTSDNQRGVLYEGHNYYAVAQSVDGVLLMTYEWGYTYGPPLAVAPINNVRDVVLYALTRIEPEKLYLGIPTYGYDFLLPYVRGESRAPSISPQEAVGLARRYGAEIQYDETAQSPFFNYTDEAGRQHEVWFEDARSIQAKLNLVNEFKLKGVGYWNMMRPFAQNWLVLNSMFNIEKLI